MTDLSSRQIRYQPNAEILSAIKDITLVIVVGPSSVGKTTLMAAAVRQTASVHLVLSDTSRAPRPGEQDGVDYYFRSIQEMTALMDQRAFVQIAPIVSGDLYASRPESYGAAGEIAMMAVWVDAVEQFRQLPFSELRTIFVTPPNFTEWQRRLGIRNFSPEQRAVRFAEARRSFEFAIRDQYLKLVINDDLRLASQDFMQLIHGQTNAKLEADQSKARGIITDILYRLG